MGSFPKTYIDPTLLGASPKNWLLFIVIDHCKW